MTHFVAGTVGQMLTSMIGVWHDQVSAFALDGTPLEIDDFAGARGALPFDNLVYIDFDGTLYRQTNVTFRGRPLASRSFTGLLKAGILHFDVLGPNDPGHIGVAGGQNILIFCSAQYNEATLRYSEPDFIHLISPAERLRSTILYRHGIAVRTLLARGTKLTPDTSRRLAFDPRGAEGSVHDARSVTTVYQAQE